MAEHNKYKEYYPVPNHTQFARLLAAFGEIVALEKGDPYELDSLMIGLAEDTCMTKDEVTKILKQAADDWKTIQDQEVRADEIENIRSEAAELFEEEGIIEIDPNAEVIEVDGKDDGQPGAWVQAWVWVEADVDKDQCVDCGEDLCTLTEGRCQACNDKEKERNKR